jgi:transposase
MELVLRLLRGESLDALSRETKQTASRISQWRDDFLAGGEQAMKAQAGPDQSTHEAERRSLQAKIGEITMDNEWLYQRCAKLEAGLPPARRRSKR